MRARMTSTSAHLRNLNRPKTTMDSFIPLPALLPECRQREEALGIDADGGARRAGSHASRPAIDVHAHVAFHRMLGDPIAMHGPQALILARPRTEAEQQPAEQPRLGGRRSRHLNYTVGTVARTVAATDAAVVNEDLPARRPMDGVRRA